MENYDTQKIESKWQEYWEKTGAHKAIESKEKFYCLDFFPYPSGEGLHVGHWRGYVLSDIIARYQKLNGKNILHPMGFDAFGLPAENAAIKENSHPKEYTDNAIKRFTKQLKQIGAMYDWERVINSSEPDYYKWTQWIFLKLYQAGLAYRKKAPVNWCPNCQTVLANEQVVAGECERCSTKVTKKELTQWFFKITNYTERLLNNLKDLNWPQRTKLLQTNWIGKSNGSLVKFNIAETDLAIEVFTTRIDTLFGATFMVLAPEHRLVQAITSPEHIKEVQSYIEKTKSESDILREEVNRKKTGVFTGAYAINPANKEKIPIWISDYVLLSYGTGAVMCVPGHDKRDFDFAKKFDLEIRQVISPDGNENKEILPFVDEGVLINSDDFDKLISVEAKEKITQELAKNNLANFETKYRLRDWLVSRQRYWGAPIPIVYCQNCGEIPVPQDQLPVLLPEDVEFKPKGESPLKQSKEFLNTICPNCSGAAIRETDTLDTFVDSSWYYLRFTDPDNKFNLASKDKIKAWMPVDLYIGGIEHATLHLLYARFVSMVLSDLKIVDFSPNGEPFQRLFNIGLIYLHGAKMSKSKGNVVTPDELVKKYGTDALRGYEMFVGPTDQDSEWQVSGISGIYRFLQKVWNFSLNLSSDATSENNLKIINQTINKVSENLISFRINTAISSLMEAFNNFDKNISKEDFGKIIILMSPIFPHISEEIWQHLGNKKSIFQNTWPEIQKKYLEVETLNLPIQINGKTKTVINIKKDLNQDEVEKIVFSNNVSKFIKDKNILKVIYVPGRIINFVVK